MILSIGTSRQTAATLAKLALDCNALIVDVRAKPLSRRHEFDRPKLEALLGTRYEYRGDRLGGQAPGMTKPPDIKRADIEELARDSEARNLILLCQEEAPIDCHRHWLIAVPLLDLGVEVWHLYGSEAVPASELVAWKKRNGKPNTAGHSYEYVEAPRIIAHAGETTEPARLE